MTKVLVLGGTGWLSRLVAHRWVEQGADVTVLARGERPAPAGVELVRGDRSAPDGYARLAGRGWDEVVDISSTAAHVSSALATLGCRAGHWTFVSTVSVYADASTPGADESADLAHAAGPQDEYDYAREKVAAEQAVREVLGDRAAIIRPGLIVGAGDPSDRFGYWVSRFALAGSEPVLVPRADGAMAQVVDVEDLASFVVETGHHGWTGIVDAVGDPLPLRELLHVARTVAGHLGEVVEADDDWLVDHRVNHWAGPRSLPLWLPPETAGLTARSNRAYKARGGMLAPLEDTLARTLADERARGLGRHRASGLDRADELELIAELGR